MHKSFVSSRAEEKRWEDLSVFDPAWQERMEVMATLLPADGTVTDFGCGPMWLTNYLTKQHIYVPVDCYDRGAGTIVCDFTAYEFPAVRGGTAFVAGCLEYIEDWQWFLGQIARQFDVCILSYNTVDQKPDKAPRRVLGWLNDLTRQEIVAFMKQNNWVQDKEGILSTGDTIFRFLST